MSRFSTDEMIAYVEERRRENIDNFSPDLCRNVLPYMTQQQSLDLQLLLANPPRGIDTNRWQALMIEKGLTLGGLTPYLASQLGIISEIGAGGLFGPITYRTSSEVQIPTQWVSGGSGGVSPMLSAGQMVDYVAGSGGPSMNMNAQLYQAINEAVGVAPENQKRISLDYDPSMSLDDYVDMLIKNSPDKARKKWLMIFRKCVLPQSVKETIGEAITVVLQAKKFKDWGFNEEFEKGLTNSILIYGPPGTGKTMISESIAAVLGKNLMKVTTAEIQSQIPGQAERNITKAFEKARSEKCVLLFDECDSLLYNRDAVGMIMAAEINHLLGQIENFDGVVLLTTNRMGRLDPALQRRIIAKVELPIPAQKEREQIWKNLIPKKMPINKDIDFVYLASHPISGGEIKNVIILSARKAIAKNKDEINMDIMKDCLMSVMKSKNDFEKTMPKRVDNIPQMDKVRCA